MEFFLLPIPIWLVVIIYAIALIESILAGLRYMAHWGLFGVQAVGVVGYSLWAYSIWATVEALGMLQYALFLQVLVLSIAMYGFYRWYQVSYWYWKYQYQQTKHVLDSSIEGAVYKRQGVQLLTFSHYVALTFVVIMLWLFLAKIYSMELSVRAENQGLVGLIAFVLTMHYIGNFLLAHFFLEGWMLRILARGIEIVFLIFRDMASPLLLAILGSVLLVNIWAWWYWRRSIGSTAKH